MRASILFLNCSWNFRHLLHCLPFILLLHGHESRPRPRLRTPLRDPKLR
jgi:hypothetical protein